QRSYVALKLAQTLDGRIAAAPGQRTSISGSPAVQEVHRLRAGFDGILVGSGTVRVDDPLLTVRGEAPCRKPPARVVLDTRARTSPGASLFQDVATSPVIIFTGEDASELAMEELEDAGAQVHPVPRDADGVSLDAVLQICWEIGLRSLFCEGGATLASVLLRTGQARRLFLFVAPFVLGPRGVPAFPEAGSRELWEGWVPAFPPSLFGRDALLTFDRVD
ncbi:RibD family protein, partial [Gemmatimonadota bacterium]